MKIFSTTVVLLASIGFGNAADFCAPQPKSCSNVPQASAKSCSAYISKAGLRLTTCSKPRSTVTKTSTTQPLATQTVVVTRTITSTIATNIQRTIMSTVTNTAISHTTIVETIKSTAQVTVVVPETLTITQGVIISSTITESVPYQTETCAAATPVVRRNQNNYKALDIVPRDCSCYLTTTTTCGQTTTTKTLTKPTSTATVTKVKLETLTRYEPKTSDVLLTATIVVSAISSDLSTTTITTTETQSVTSDIATTITTTSTATATQTVQADPCADPTLYTSTRPDYPGSAWGARSDSDSPKDCCQRCFNSNVGCLFWQYSNYVCTQYVIPNKNDAVSCITKSCRKGRPTLISAAGDGTTWGVGICAAAGFNG